MTANPQNDQNWRQGRITINGNIGGAIIIEGIVGSTTQGDIAIDDISVTQGQCSVRIQGNPENVLMPHFPQSDSDSDVA